MLKNDEISLFFLEEFKNRRKLHNFNFFDPNLKIFSKSFQNVKNVE